MQLGSALALFAHVLASVRPLAGRQRDGKYLWVPARHVSFDPPKTVLGL